MLWGFSPRNGEVILKTIMKTLKSDVRSFSPRNGEVILKVFNWEDKVTWVEFQSPQWGSNSKVTSSTSETPNS